MIAGIAWVLGIGFIIHTIHKMYLIEDCGFTASLEKAGWIFAKNLAMFVILMIVFSFMIVYIQSVTDSSPYKHYYECRSQIANPLDLDIS